MKIRYGFVSNSSSSSFVAVLSAKAYEEIVKELVKDAKLVKLLTTGKAKPKRGIVDGVEIVMVSGTSGEMGCYFNEYDYVPDWEEPGLSEDWEDAPEVKAINAVEAAVLKKNKLVVRQDS